MMGGGGGNPNQSEPQMLPASESWVRVPAQCCALSYCLMAQGGAPAALTSHISVRAKARLLSLSRLTGSGASGPAAQTLSSTTETLAPSSLPSWSRSGEAIGRVPLYVPEFLVRVVSPFDLAVEPRSPTPFPPSVPGFAKTPTTQADPDSAVQPPAAFLPSKGKQHRHAHTLTPTHVRVHTRTLTAPERRTGPVWRLRIGTSHLQRAPPPPQPLSPSGLGP